MQVPQQIVPALEAGQWAQVPVLAGTNTNEADTFVYDGVSFWLPFALYRDALELVFGTKVASCPHPRLLIP